MEILLIVEDAVIRSFVEDVTTDKFVWSEWIKIRMTRGDVLDNGFYRDARKCTVEDGVPQLQGKLMIFKTFRLPRLMEMQETFAGLNITMTLKEVEEELNRKVNERHAM